MHKRTVERRLKQVLATKGVTIIRGSTADRSLKTVSEVTADVSRAGERLVNEASKTIKVASEKLRARVHEATRPPR